MFRVELQCCLNPLPCHAARAGAKTVIDSGWDRKERPLGPNALLISSPVEHCMIRALDQDLVFLGLLHGAPSNESDRVGGMLR